MGSSRAPGLSRRALLGLTVREASGTWPRNVPYKDHCTSGRCQNCVRLVLSAQRLQGVDPAGRVRVESAAAGRAL